MAQTRNEKGRIAAEKEEQDWFLNTFAGRSAAIQYEVRRIFKRFYNG